MTDDPNRPYDQPVDQLEMVDAIWPSVIKEELWYQANRRLQMKRIGGRERRDTAEKLLSGIGKCHVCKAVLVGGAKRRYQCDGWPAGDPRGGGHTSILQSVGDEIVEAAVIARLADRRLRDYFEETDEEREQRRESVLELARVRRAMEELPGKVERDEVSVMLAASMERKLKQQIKKLEEAARPKGMHPLVDKIAVPDQRAVEKAWASLDMFQRREILVAIADTVELKPVGRSGRHSASYPERSFHIVWVT